MSVDLIGASSVEDDRIDKRIAETNVNQPRLFELDLQEHVIELRPEAAVVAAHARRKHLHLKPDGRQKLIEQAIQFVAESPATVRDNFLVESRRLEVDRGAKLDIEILERNGK